MFSRALLRGLYVGLGAAVTLSAGAVTAEADDITSADPRIENGRLVITGTTATARMKLRLDGETGAAFNVTSANDASKAFAFNLLYLPSDCVITLQKLTGTSTLGAPTDWLVANCGVGLLPRGPWSGALSYLANDLVTFRGSSWRAKRDSFNKTPRVGLDWEQFAAKGAKGDTGPQGEPGADGGSPKATLETCNDSGGWNPDPSGAERVYCLDACAEGEVVTSSRIERTSRDGSIVSGATDAGYVPAQSAPAAPIPGGKWYVLFFANATANPNQADQFSSVTLRIFCAAP